MRTRIGGESKLDTRVIADMAAQLIEKRSHGLIKARFVLFGSVGATGVVVNLGLLTWASRMGAPFWLAQAYAVMAAMSTNFMLNNLLTFRDRRLTGRAFWRGLIAFYIACTGGAALNEAVGAGLHLVGKTTALAGIAGVVVAAAWNYLVASRMAWGLRTLAGGVLRARWAGVRGA